MNIRRILVAVLVLTLLGTALAGCPKQEPKPEPVKVSVMLDWTPNTNYTGLYVAKDKGYFAEQGLEVDIVEPAEGGVAQMVASGKIDFGISYQEEVTQARATDIPIVSIGAIIQHNTSGFASPKDRNITRPKDLEGKRYGGWGSPIENAILTAIMARDGADANKVQFVNVGSADVFTLYQRDIDFSWIFYAWTGIEAELRGTPLNIIMLKDIDPALDYYTPVIITSEKNIAERADVVKKFMAAASKGYEFAIANPEQAAESLLKAAPELNRDLVVASQKWLSPRYRDEGSRWGEQKLEVWKRYADWMFERKLIPKNIEPEKAFTNDFLPAK